MNIIPGKKVTKSHLSLLQKINPLNKDIEKEKFFFDTSYNPQFEYEEDTSFEELETYGKVSDKYVGEAKKIIDQVIKTYGTETNYLEQVEGKLLSQDESVAAIEKYLQENGLENTVELSFSSNFISRTSVKKIDNRFQLQIRLPTEYREHALQGTLDHEIGTHVFRWINELEQPWSERKSKFKLTNHLLTEEGMAALHTFLSRQNKYLWLYALYYYSVYLGNTLSFSQLFRALQPYIDDKERRWRHCLRVKRGLKDTSLPLVFTKDQVYFLGVLEVFKWLKAHTFDPTLLYLGKISIHDIPKLEKISKHSVILPKFAQDKKFYRENIEKIIKINHLEL